MCKSSKGTKTANPALEKKRQIQPATDGNAGGGGGNGGGGSSTGGGGPDPEASAPAAIMFEPDFAPQLTFIAKGDDGFIKIANKFHKQIGLKVEEIASIEELLEKLLDKTITQEGLINRMRIVSHVYVSASALDDPANMKIPFLKGGSRNSLKRFFTGFAGTSIDALRAMMTFEYTSFTDLTIYLCQNGASDIILSAKNAASTASFNKIATDPLGDPVDPKITDFLKICMSMWLIKTLPVQPHYAVFKQAYDMLLADAKPKLVGALTAQDLDTIQNAILAIGPVTYKEASPGKPAEFASDLTKAIAVIQSNTLRANLDKVRKRFDSKSRIDIRGCQIGRDPEFLTAIQTFFGTDATRRPTVSGPKWYQHFNAIGYRSVKNNGNITTLYNSGIAGMYTANQLRAFLDQWADGFGIKANHLTFWQTAFGLPVLEFLALQWRTPLPATTLPVPRLLSLGTAAFSDLLTQLGAVFYLPAATPLSAGDITGITPLLPQCATWNTQLKAEVPDAATEAELKATLANYKVIYEKIDKRVGSGTPPTDAQRIIPATVPATLTVTEVRDFQTKLKQFIDTNTNSRLVKMKTLLDAALAKVLDGPAKMRYYLGIGLPFLVYNPAAAANVEANHVILAEDSGSAAAGRQTDAVKFWARVQWRGVIPADLGKNLVFPEGLETPWLVEKHQGDTGLTIPPFVVSPTPEYQDKIVTINA
ncbi:hypothetical protein [Chitinophaga sp. sic0106]|uniref:hypothetical protein n=1 Tax=Chitinophaga sp. sic0106 TaxID=2854785 RepID=UPI001C48775C|nr:hypothetical protein [Chitinophaga sp. sic0106]MBV7530644.1 hypothetical protein [Chitinophaga sp. sic0106]